MALDTMTNNTQDAIVCRIENFPANITRNALDKNTIPKIMVRSRQIFEGIFTYLHAHPCYMITWIKKHIRESAEIEGLIYQVYGKKEMRDNARVINTLSVIARAIFDHECEE